MISHGFCSKGFLNPPKVCLLARRMVGGLGSFRARAPGERAGQAREPASTCEIRASGDPVNVHVGWRCVFCTWVVTSLKPLVVELLCWMLILKDCDEVSELMAFVMKSLSKDVAKDKQTLERNHCPEQGNARFVGHRRWGHRTLVVHERTTGYWGCSSGKDNESSIENWTNIGRYLFKTPRS